MFFTLHEKRKEAGSYSHIKFGLVAVSILLTLFMFSGAFLGYFYTNQRYVQKELKQNLANNPDIYCRTQISKGESGEVKSQYFIYEQSQSEEGCEKFIEYKNLPEDTESFSLTL